MISRNGLVNLPSKLCDLTSFDYVFGVMWKGRSTIKIRLQCCRMHIMCSFYYQRKSAIWNVIYIEIIYQYTKNILFIRSQPLSIFNQKFNFKNFFFSLSPPNLLQQAAPFFFLRLSTESIVYIWSSWFTSSCITFLVGCLLVCLC